MPAKTGPSSCSAVLPILPSPSARSVPRCRWLSPIWLRTWVIRTFATWRLLGRRRDRLGRLLHNGMLVRQNLADCQAARPRHVLGAAEVLQPVHGRLCHVDRVRGAEALREDVADAGDLQDSADAATGDHAGSFARWA